MNFETASTWRLTNRYFVLRHGESMANRQGIIVSAPEVGTDGYGLTDRGSDFVRKTIKESAKVLEGTRVIYTSDFCRARQTAEIAAEVLAVPVCVTADLRERYFGSWDQTSNENYQRVWHRDLIDPVDLRNEDRVESVAEVATRMARVIRELEQAYTGETILLVSHGDPLQILIATFQGLDVRRHRDVPSLGTSELRALQSGARAS